MVAILFLSRLRDVAIATTRHLEMNCHFFQHLKKTNQAAIAYLELSGTDKNTV